jgi:hypothetical protein
MYWLSRHCGNSIPEQIVSTTPTLILVFRTDRMLQNRGFKFHFHFSYLNILPLVTEPICGLSEITGSGGVLNSPNYPHTFPDDTECAWTITVEKHQKILIKFLDINLIQPCSLSYISIWDGYVSDITKPDINVCEKLKYYHKGLRQYTSKSNRLVIKFHGNVIDGKSSHKNIYQADSTMIINSNKMNVFDWGELDNRTIDKISQMAETETLNGFKFSWTGVHIEDDCPEFSCKGGEYCIDTKNLICQETYK